MLLTIKIWSTMDAPSLKSIKYRMNYGNEWWISFWKKKHDLIKMNEKEEREREKKTEIVLDVI